MVWPDGSGDILWDLTRDTNFTAEVSSAQNSIRNLAQTINGWYSSVTCVILQVIGTLPEGSTPVLSLTHLITNASLHNCFLDKTRSPSPAKVVTIIATTFSMIVFHFPQLLPVGIISEAVTGLITSKVNQLQLAQLLEYLMVNNPM